MGKEFKMKIILILAFILSYAVSPCAYGQDMDDLDRLATQSVIGTWQASYTIDNVSYVFRNEYLADMSFVTKVSVEHTISKVRDIHFSGKWIVMANDLIREVVNTTDPKHFPIGLVSSLSILTISDSMIIYRLDNGLGVVSRNVAHINRVW
jgi:hypothetical protein